MIRFRCCMGGYTPISDTAQTFGEKLEGSFEKNIGIPLLATINHY